MAKSLRASSKVKARNNRRYNDNTDYAVTQAARLNAISQRLADRVKGSQAQDEKSDGDDEEMAEENVTATGAKVPKAAEEDGDPENKEGWYLPLLSDGSSLNCAALAENTSEEHVSSSTEFSYMLGLVDPDHIGFSDEDDDGRRAKKDGKGAFHWLWKDSC